MKKPIEEWTIFELMEVLKRQKSRKRIIYLIREHRKAFQAKHPELIIE